MKQLLFRCHKNLSVNYVANGECTAFSLFRINKVFHCVDVFHFGEHSEKKSDERWKYLLFSKLLAEEKWDARISVYWEHVFVCVTITTTHELRIWILCSCDEPIKVSRETMFWCRKISINQFQLDNIQSNLFHQKDQIKCLFLEMVTVLRYTE